MKIKQPSIKLVQKKLWDECKRIIKVRYGSDCYTCDAKNLTGSNRHTGHLIPKKYLPYTMKYDLRLLRPQCYNCNMNLGGMGAMFLWNTQVDPNFDMLDIVYKLIIDKKDKPKQKEVCEFYTNLLKEYEKITK